MFCVSNAAHAAPSVVRLALASEPGQLDSGRATAVAQIFVLGHVFEGLTRYGKNGEVVPGVAESWKLTPRGATFHLRKAARWSDGRPVTAADFVFAWRRVVDPKTASPYAAMLAAVLNAEAITNGKKPPAELGVKAAGPATLEVTFERPCAYFLALTAFPTYAPARQDFVEQAGDRYGADVATILSDGPYRLTEWVHGASLALEKNPSYWNAKEIHIDRVEVPFMTADPSARYNLFRGEKTDLVSTLGPAELGRAQADRMKIQTFKSGELTFLRFNFRPRRPTANLHLRRAITAAIDTRELATSVIGVPGTRPGKGIVPETVRGVSKSFRQEHPLPDPKRDVSPAKRELELAKKDFGGQIPPLVYLASDTAQQGREAEYFQAQLKKNLGIDLKIERQILKVAIAKQFAGEFDLASSSWFGDFQDPVAYLEILVSTDKNNRGKYVNTKYDAQIAQAESTADPRKRMDLLAKAEAIALEDAAILPKSESVEAYILSPKLKGVIRRGTGADPDFTYAELAP
jgi:oligopeptide transport system substrate-binding protein